MRASEYHAAVVINCQENETRANYPNPLSHQGARLRFLPSPDFWTARDGGE